MINIFRNKNEQIMYLRFCHLYLEKNGDRALVAACYNHGGLFAEIPNSVEESSQSDTSNLGAIILEMLNKCVYQEEFDYSTQKAKDCPAYLASGLKTVTSFETQFLRYMIQGENESNHFYRVTSPQLCNDIELSLVFKASEFDFQIGLDVMKLHRFYLEAEKIL